MKLIFRADGGAAMGLGHLIRSSALADMISTYFPILFLVNDDSPEGIKTDLAKKYEILTAKNDAELLNSIDKGDGVILDGYHFSSDFQMEIKKKAAVLISIDDVHDKHFFSDLVINQALGITARDYSAEPYTKFLFGPRYCIVRRPFLVNQNKYHYDKTPGIIFICFGGSDFQNITLSLLRELVVPSNNLRFNVVVGVAYQHLEELEKFAELTNSVVSIYSGLGAAELSELIRSSDIAIAPGSSILLEILSSGIPAISGYYAENQLDIYNGYLQEGLLIGAGDFRNTREAARIITNTLDRTPPIDSQKLSYYFDGNSPSRLLKEFIQLFSGSCLSLNPVTNEDSKLLFEWANDTETRNNAINTKPILWEEHTKWFLDKQKSPDTIMFIAKFNGLPVGQIRFDGGHEFIDLTYSVAPSHRGVGFGSCIVQQAIKEVSELFPISRKIRAFVIDHNLSSAKIFRKMNFKECQMVIKEGRNFYQFQYSLN
jgi:UDP-2,4-diacetamido-2,4,6-trideoxy-beta-L-altropyranose hydrolase